ncbi:hypothetical protein COLO4_10176 [Corchorus olitorius]|uniref:Uncharacterized protein n=1 Tax=Corchorus olitorius TaxID=93759 RepID=A0A1R3K9P5_9ROSI|nr:hypothetical protein COLO4_10176 [Corchorus olitorius]
MNQPSQPISFPPQTTPSCRFNRHHLLDEFPFLGSHMPSSWISRQVLWIPSDLVLSVDLEAKTAWAEGGVTLMASLLGHVQQWVLVAILEVMIHGILNAVSWGILFPLVESMGFDEIGGVAIGFRWVWRRPTSGVRRLTLPVGGGCKVECS